MRKKQLYAILLAGTLAAGAVPSAVWAAEDAAAVSETSESSADTPAGEEEGNASQPDVQQTPAADDTAAETPSEPAQAPAESGQTPEAAEPTQAPAAENEVTEVPVQQENAAASPQAEDQPAADSEETPDPAADTGIFITTVSEDGSEKKNYYESLQAAVDAVPAATGAEGEKVTVIEVTKQLALSNTVNISGKKVCIKAAANISIGRGADSGGTALTGDMFAVSGTNSELQFATEDGFSMTVDGGTADSTGAIVHVTEGGAFGLFQGVTMTNNNSSALGGAVTNEGGSIVLQGGTITGNKGEKGAVYTNNDIAVQGTVSIKDNNGANLYLDNNAAAVVTGEMTGSSVSLTAANAADQRIVLKAGADEDGTPVSAEAFQAAVGQFVYDTGDFSINLGEDGQSAALKPAASVSETPAPTPSAAPSGTPAPTTTPAATATPTPTTKPEKPTDDKFSISIHTTTLKWINHNTISVDVTVSEDCKWYYFIGKAGITKDEILKDYYHETQLVHSASANTKFTVTLKDIGDEDFSFGIVAKSNSGTIKIRALDKMLNYPVNSNGKKVAFKEIRPAADSVTSRAPKTHSVTESTVTGLEEPLKFYPSTFYEFQVTGAGQNDSEPYVTGDERWIPLYWSTSQNPTDSQKNTTWRIGSVSGIRQAATYNMYIFFKKQAYNGSSWIDTDVVDYMVTQFRSAEITDEELDNWKVENNVTTIPGEDDGYGVGLAATEGASTKDGSSSSKSAVSTADESPVKEMTALAALSLAAGGYILIRKRKKES